MKPRVSVVIPCFNHASYLDRAIHSVLAQEFGAWEAIVVNDGSTDDTATVVAQYDDPRIRYIYQDNQGLSAARNTGIRAAEGIYLAFLDADDEWEPDFLQCCVGVLESGGTLAGVYTLNYFIDDQGTRLPQLGGQIVSTASFRSRNLEGGFFPPNAVLVRSGLVRAVGLFDTRLTSEEDWDLWIRISERHEMQGIPRPLARYRVHPGSMSTNAARMHANRMLVLAKYFGPPEGDPHGWPEEKRQVYAFAYQSTARQYIQQGQSDEGWHFMTQAISTWPLLLERVDTFYELACDDQPFGFRGQADQVDLAESGAKMLGRLHDVLAADSSVLAPLRRPAYSNAYLALAMLSDQAGRWNVARRYLLRASRANPRLLISVPFLRRLLKLCAGHRLVDLGRRLLGDRQQVAVREHLTGVSHEPEVSH